MKVARILKDSLRLIRTTRLVWAFGSLSVLVTFFGPLAPYVQPYLLFVCVFLPTALVLSLVTFISEGALVFCVHQATLARITTFADAWRQSKAKALRLIGQFIIVTPATLIASFILQAIAAKVPDSPLVWLVALVIQSFTWGLSTFGVCAIMISNLKAGAAAWTGFLITVNNFLRILVITGAMLLLRLAFTAALALVLVRIFRMELPLPANFGYLAYQDLLDTPVFAITNSALNIILVTVTIVCLSVGYLQFIKEIEYPALAIQREQPNTGST